MPRVSKGFQEFIYCPLIAAFLTLSLYVPEAQGGDLVLPVPGIMVRLSTAFNPPILKGIKVHPDNPFRFDFILDKGDSLTVGEQLKQESNRLIKYFLASLTIPERDLWVNLSPYEKDRIVPESFGQTEMGRDLLAQDYILKQITASLIYPEDAVGKKFWKRVYEEAAQKFGTTNIPVNTFNKVWIVPEKAVVYENAKAGTAYVVDSKLKVMLEQDYLSLQKNTAKSAQQPVSAVNALGSQIVREIVLPQLTNEVNHGGNFIHLRQVYNSLILATWYKKKIKDSILEQVYTDKNKVAGVEHNDSQAKQKIYERYLQAFKKGVYNFVKEEVDPLSQQVIPRKYFSGGMHMDMAMMTVTDHLPLQRGREDLFLVTSDALALHADGVSGVDEAMSVTKRGLRIGTLSLLAALAVGAGSGYSLMRWGYDIDAKYLFTIPQVNGSLSVNFDMKVIEEAHGKGQLNSFFNELRTQPDNLYEYLSEIPDEQMTRFAQYFSTLKPGIRQQVLSMLSSKLKKDFLVLENSLTPRFYAGYTQLEQRAEKLRRLYSKIVQVLNRVVPLKEGEIPEGPLQISQLPSEPVQPEVEIPFTRKQSLDFMKNIFFKAVNDYVARGYRVTLPRPSDANVSKIAALIGYYTPVDHRYSEYSLSGGHSFSSYASFLVENKAAQLLSWVIQTSDPLRNPNAHRITEEELLQKSLELNRDDENKTVDLFGSIATIGQYYKSLARSPQLMLGGAEARRDSDGADFIWNHHDPMWLAWTLDPTGEYTVDDQGRPVRFWRPVDVKGDTSIPQGQRTGIRRFTTDGESYHAWNMILTSFYTAAKSFTEIDHDFKSALLETDTQAAVGSDQTTYDVFKMLTWSGEAGSNQIWRLPYAYKYAQVLNLEPFAWDIKSFDSRRGLKGSSRERASYLMGQIGRWLFDDATSLRLFVGSTASDEIATSSALKFKSILGGRDFDEYLSRVEAQWQNLRANYSEPLAREMEATFSAFTTWAYMPSLEFKLPKQFTDSFVADLLTDGGKAKELLAKDRYLLDLIISNVSDQELLNRLGHDSNLAIRKSVARNPNTPFPLLNQLSVIDDAELQQRVFLNPNTPLGTKWQMYHNRRTLEPESVNIVIQIEGLKGNKFDFNTIVKRYGVLKPTLSRIYDAWMQKNQGAAFPTEAAELLTAAESVLRNAPGSDELRNYQPSGDLMIDLNWLVSKLDKAQLGDNKGGIDLNTDKLNLQVQNGGNGITFHIDPAQLRQLQSASGFTPVIINIQPISDVRLFLGLSKGETQPQLAGV